MSAEAAPVSASPRSRRAIPSAALLALAILLSALWALGEIAVEPRVALAQAHCGCVARIANSPNDNETFRRGEHIVVKVAHFHEDLVVDNSGGNPTIPIRIGGKTVWADYRNTDSRALFFVYEVQADDKAEDGTIVPGNSITVPQGSSIKDIRGNYANYQRFVSEGNPRLKADGGLLPPAATPRVVGGPFIRSQPSIDSDGDGVNDTYGPNEVIEIEYELSGLVCGSTSTLLLLFQTGDGATQARDAIYGGCGGRASRVIVFKHAVAQGDLDEDGFEIAGDSLRLGRFLRGWGAIHAHAAFSAGPLHKVNGNLPYSGRPYSDSDQYYLSIANEPNDGETFRRGEHIIATADFKEDIVIDNSGGNPTIGIEIGENIVLADYAEHAVVGNSVRIKTGGRVIFVDHQELLRGCV